MAITQQALRKLLRYNQETGAFTRLARTSNRVRVGDRAGFADANGYICICVLGRREYAHRLAWLWMTGMWPVEIDHRNGERADNSWKNLREAASILNKENQRRAHHDSKSGVLGVHPYPHGFRARIQAGGKQVNLGCFRTAAAASEAYLKAKREMHQGCTI